MLTRSRSRLPSELVDEPFPPPPPTTASCVSTGWLLSYIFRSLQSSSLKSSRASPSSLQRLKALVYGPSLTPTGRTRLLLRSKLAVAKPASKLDFPETQALWDYLELYRLLDQHVIMTLETQRRGWVSDTCPLSGDSENLSGTEALVDDPDSNHIDACDTDKLSGDLGPAEVSVEFGDQPEEDPNLLKCTLAQDGQPPLSPRRSTPMSLRIDAPLPPDTPPPTPPRPCPAKIGTLTPQPLALTRPASLRAPGTGLDTFPSRTQVSIPAVNDGGNGSDDGQDAIDLMTQTPVTENPQPTHHLKSLKVDDHVVVGPGTCKMIASSTRAARNLRERNQPIAVCIDIGQHGKDTVHYARCANLALSHLVLPGWHYLEVLTIHDAHSALECGSGLARLFLPGVDYMLAFGPNPSANEEPWDEMARIRRSLVSTLEQREVRRVRVILPFNGYGTLPPSSACAGRLATATTSLSHDLQSIAQHLVLGERPTWVEINFLLVELIPARCASCRHPWTRII